MLRRAGTGFTGNAAIAPQSLLQLVHAVTVANIVTKESKEDEDEEGLDEEAKKKRTEEKEKEKKERKKVKGKVKGKVEGKVVVVKSLKEQIGALSVLVGWE